MGKIRRKIETTLKTVIIFLAISYFSGGIHCQDNPGDALQRQLDSLQSQINNLTLRLNTSIAGLQRQIDASNTKLDEVQAVADAAAMAIEADVLPAITSLTASTKKLNSINQTWKKNFQILNTTVQALRKKVALKAPYSP